MLPDAGPPIRAEQDTMSQETTLDASSIPPEQGQESGPGLRTVVMASAAGTAFEWYDFFIFGSLAAVIAKHFYADVGETTSYILALLTFGVGFVVRPLGALVFGWFGDKTGRKTTFLVTITLMGVATVLIGIIPDYSAIGIWAPALLIFLRIVQGFALGGEYGGAAIYVAEHAPRERRGYFTGWIQTTAAFGLIGALVVILTTRMIVGAEAFNAWGWRIPFLISAFLLAISLWIRFKLHESPAYQKMEAEAGDGAHRAPYKEAFGNWKNLKFVLLALFGIMVAQGAVWYCGYFYSRTFLEKSLKVDVATVDQLILAVTLCSAPLYVFFAWLSDRVGRKPVMLFGMILALVAFFPGFHAMAKLANPALIEAQARAPITVAASHGCGVLFDPIGQAKVTSDCDIARNLLSNAGVSYDITSLPPDWSPANTATYSGTQIHIGSTVLSSFNGEGLDAATLKARRGELDTQIKAALTAAGYPDKADPARLNWWGVFGILMIFIVAATALYGPQAAALVELFPTRVRYTAMSLPYNIGTGWVGGLLPATSFALVAASGNIYFGLWYSVIFTVISVIVSLIWLPETKGRDLDTIGT